MGTPVRPLTPAERRASLQRLHRRMRRCRRCLELGCSIVPPAIFTGGIAARIMVVGQAPGGREVEAGRPFHAQSGRRLFQWLAQAGFEEDTFRRTQYMTSVTKCFPGKAAAGGGDRRPTRIEVEACLPYLAEQLALIRPALVIPVGTLAIEAFFADRPALEVVIGTQREIDGRVVIPLPHPSGASRWHQIPANRKRISRALRLIEKQRHRLGL
ncbi:MAG TPA: uracil-DNA glycosylase family protein [Anaerolineales bacterium]|nr:uracil-DNA glycosylase family protein [Anaerolineales bacterium]